jgi:3-oxoacyl-[acyl-carrier-protein] synthase III
MRLNLKRVAANDVHVNCAPSLKALRTLSEILVAWFH